MKKLVSALLALVMACTLLPAAAAADTVPYSDDNVTWLGTQAEYQKTLDNFFQNGLRKVKVGKQWGMVDATGAFQVPPIYDKIEPYYLRYEDGQDSSREVKQRLWIGGYTQVVRGGKMGLLSATGEEVIPAQYDAVGLPSEGICRIVTQKGSANYLGYWSLALGRELVPPKYAVSKGLGTAAGLAIEYYDSGKVLAPDGWGLPSDQDYAKTAGKLRALACYDFHDGYALVPSGKQDYPFASGNIIDKTGKEILPGGPYLYSSGYGESYPQFGPYLVYLVEANGYNYGGMDLGRYWKSGVVGPKGVVIKAQYTSGVRAPITGHTLSYTNMRVIPEAGLVITTKDVYPGKEGGGRVGVVNFKNQVVIPFTHDYEFFRYDAQAKIFQGLHRGSSDGAHRMYNLRGKQLGSSNYFSLGQSVNGYCSFTRGTFNTQRGQYDYVAGVVSTKTGAEYLRGNYGETRSIPERSNVSVAGLIWQKNAAGKWGLLNLAGDVILEYQFDKVQDGSTWTRPVNGYAIVNIGKKQGLVSAGGKLLVPCTYDSLSNFAKNGPDERYVIATQNGSKGLLNVADGRTVLPCVYKEIGNVMDVSYDRSYFDLGVQPVLVDGGAILVDPSGAVVSDSQQKDIGSPYWGLFSSSAGYIGPEGKIIFPETMFYSGRGNVLNDTTLVVRGGQVGYINVEKLARPTRPRAALPVKAPADPAAVSLVVDGKSVSASGYFIDGSTYLKIRDIACLLSGTAKPVNVTWNKSKNAVELRTGQGYSPIAGDMAPGDGAAKTALRSTAPVYVDGLQRFLTAYTIGRSNFFSLRDMMRLLDVSIGTENGVLTLDTSRSYAGTEEETAGLVEADTTVDGPPAEQVNKLEILETPNLEFYMTGDHTFRTDGFELRHWDENGVPHIITDPSLMTFTVEGKVIQDGYVFTVSSMKTGTVGYAGLTAPLRFPVYLGTPKVEIPAVDGQTENGIADGRYTLSIYGKSLGLSNGWMVVDNKKPVVFTVRRSGEYYYMYVENVTNDLFLAVSPINSQLTAMTSVERFGTQWHITDLGDGTYSVREFGKRQMVVNASGQQSKDGTKIIVYSHTNTPRNAIITFTPA